MPNLSRRHLVTTAAALPALALPTVAHATACTLPPDEIERFLRMRAWFVEDHTREPLGSREHDKRFYAACGLTADEYLAFNYHDLRRKELEPLWNKAWKELQHESGRTTEVEEAETDALTEERWAVAEAMMAHEPQSIVDLAWQLEAWLIADLEMFNSSGEDAANQLLRMFVGYVRALGAVPQPDDPFGALSLADCED